MFPKPCVTRASGKCLNLQSLLVRSRQQGVYELHQQELESANSLSAPLESVSGPFPRKQNSCTCVKHPQWVLTKAPGQHVLGETICENLRWTTSCVIRCIKALLEFEGLGGSERREVVGEFAMNACHGLVFSKPQSIMFSASFAVVVVFGVCVLLFFGVKGTSGVKSLGKYVFQTHWFQCQTGTKIQCPT